MKKVWQYPYVLIASQNQHKLKEFRDLFQLELGIGVKGLDEFPDAPEIIEDQDTFEGNAMKKSETISRWLGQPVLSDDSGIVVPALDGAPGVYSARYAGEGSTDQQNVQKMLHEMESLPDSDRGAYYVCVMALSVPGEESKFVRGECHGMVADAPRGENGFGYDPVFYVPGRGQTMAELSSGEKRAISHRSIATKKLVELLKETYTFS
ncbi:XTP/dITP diphosphohydrolase [Thermoactinomyces sp. DSM 45891]|uniref:XTP/dITP diphosphatase n=1 Tax=Thermoactinomyces sp. DSM 45891 TaxID=1761907 RepID=UPI0009191621|nr:XTP/dITP diphosphatase [Thermoactinomyces sp. DSM 45891]SFX12139.1 XTP/dITP diphosphohydrolase [Thermoactinomyces sp. DSM 45891]